jgi:hypothetical protein
MFTDRANHRQKTSSTTGKSHYVQSGAYMTPFRKDHTAQRHTEEINTQAGDDTETNSAEEFPWESMAQGGTGAYLAPATRAQQGGMLSLLVYQKRRRKLPLTKKIKKRKQTLSGTDFAQPIQSSVKTNGSESHSQATWARCARR